MEDTIGIDISKERLDVCVLERGTHHQFANDRGGIAVTIYARLDDWKRGRR